MKMPSEFKESSLQFGTYLDRFRQENPAETAILAYKFISLKIYVIFPKDVGAGLKPAPTWENKRQVPDLRQFNVRLSCFFPPKLECLSSFRLRLRGRGPQGLLRESVHLHLSMIAK